MKSRWSLPVAELARRCAKEMARYRRGRFSDPRYCYELLRCALAEQNEEAWAAVYRQYHGLVRCWLGDAPGDPGALVNEAFERLWRAIPPDRSAEFPTLGSILEYLKRCARCVAIDASRRAEREQAEEAALARLHVLRAEGKRRPSEQVLDAIVGEQLIACAMKRLHSPGEQLVFRASFEWDLRPGMIAERWPGIFASAREVSRIKERLLRRLRRDEGIRALLEMDE